VSFDGRPTTPPILDEGEDARADHVPV
jgi:hypothetical protein